MSAQGRWVERVIGVELVLVALVFAFLASETPASATPPTDQLVPQPAAPALPHPRAGIPLPTPAAPRPRPAPEPQR